MHPHEMGCRVCGQVHDYEPPEPGSVALCARCGSKLAIRTRHGLHLSGAFALCALLLYLPANVFPIMRMNLYGSTADSTIWQGCVRLYRDGDAIIAIIVFLASILIPFLKLLGLFFLSVSAHLRMEKGIKARLYVYKFIETIGKWAMLDVFVLAVLVALVKLSRLATIQPGPGATAFTGVVVFTLLASANFDSQLLWNTEDTANESP